MALSCSRLLMRPGANDWLFDEPRRAPARVEAFIRVVNMLRKEGGAPPLSRSSFAVFIEDAELARQEDIADE